MINKLEQLYFNCKWLIDKIDQIHKEICPGQNGSWTQRAEQCVEAAKNISANLKKPESKTLTKRDQSNIIIQHLNKNIECLNSPSDKALIESIKINIDSAIWDKSENKYTPVSVSAKVIDSIIYNFEFLFK